MQSTAELRRAQDLNFVIEEFSTNCNDIVSDVATLMRSGLLRKAINKASGIREIKGAELSKSCDSLRNLRDGLVRRFLTECEPEKLKKEVVTPLPKAMVMDMICFALNGKPGTKLPKDFPDLLWEEPLLQYMKMVYVEAG